MATEPYTGNHRAGKSTTFTRARHATWEGLKVFKDGMLPILVFEAMRPAFEHGLIVIEALGK